jgi:hypothetical protein
MQGATERLEIYGTQLYLVDVLFNWRMPSSGMWSRVDLMLTDFSEERVASIFRLEKWRLYGPPKRRPTQDLHGSHCSHLLTLVPRSRIFLPWRWKLYVPPKHWFTQDLKGSTLQPPAHSGSSFADFSTLKMEVIRTSETSAHTRSTRRHIPEDGILHSHRRENLKTYILFNYFSIIRLNRLVILESLLNVLSFLPDSINVKLYVNVQIDFRSLAYA